MYIESASSLLPDASAAAATWSRASVLSSGFRCASIEAHALRAQHAQTDSRSRRLTDARTPLLCRAWIGRSLLRRLAEDINLRRIQVRQWIAFAGQHARHGRRRLGSAGEP